MSRKCAAHVLGEGGRFGGWNRFFQSRETTLGKLTAKPSGLYARKGDVEKSVVNVSSWATPTDDCHCPGSAGHILRNKMAALNLNAGRRPISEFRLV